jgi:hypothetical protein
LLRAAPSRNNFLPHGIKAGELASLITSSLDASKPLHGYLKASAVLTELYLARLRKNDFDPARAGINAPPVTFAVRALAGRFR